MKFMHVTLRASTCELVKKNDCVMNENGIEGAEEKFLARSFLTNIFFPISTIVFFDNFNYDAKKSNKLYINFLLFKLN